MGTEKKAAVEVQENQTEQAAAQVQAPVAYCGPTIKGIAPQYTVFVDGLPDKLKEKSGTGAASESTDRSAGQTR